MSRSPYHRNRVAWRSYNENRIKRALEISPDGGKLALDMVPFLLHVNMPGLPGYMDGSEPPCGVYMYVPSEEAINLVKKNAPGFDAAKAKMGIPNYDQHIESILIMGSIGTMAQTKSSDYDYWVVIDEEKMSPEKIGILRKKLDAIEAWAAEQKIEIHFFITLPSKTRANDFGDTDKESAGSSQAHVLKEEFYRTVILVAGKDPVWWILPAGLTDEQYEQSKNDLIDEGVIDESELVDFGNVDAISKGELFGSLLWQFNKATTSPYKSALKMAMLDSYINAGVGERLLCDVLKGAIHANPDKTDQADPYLLMFDYIRRHYVKTERKKAAACLEKCFYLKSCDKPIESASDAEGLIYKEKTLRSLLRHWKWSQGQLAGLNNFENWEYSQASELGREIHKFMLDTYKELYDNVAKNPNVKSIITEKDRTVLGRKLFAIYDYRNKAKIEYMKRVMNEAKHLEAISFAVSVKHGKQPVWGVYKGDIRSEVAKGGAINHFLLRKGPDLAGLMLWLVANEIYDKSTFLYYIPDTNISISLKDLQQLLKRIGEFFPPFSLSDLNNEELMSRAYVTRAFVIVNFVSQRWQKEIETVSVLYSTSWGESFSYTMPAKTGLPKLLDVLGQTSSSFGLTKRDVFEIFAPKSENEAKLVKKLKDFLAKKFKRVARDAHPII